jgi:putative transcription factor
MQCELCGRECDCKPATIDGVKMMLCPNCMKYGIGIKEEKPISVKQKIILGKISKPQVKDIYKDMDKELVSNWNELIKNARKNKGLSREELGFKINERTVTIAKIENGDLRPSDDIVKKLEKELGINLVEKVDSGSSFSATTSSKKGLTLGDFFKKEEK